MNSINSFLLLLGSIIYTLDGGLDSHLGLIVNMMNSIILKSGNIFENSNSTKIDLLKLIQDIIKFHSIESLSPYIAGFSNLAEEAIKDSFYQVRAEAVDLMSCLIGLIRPTGHSIPDSNQSIFLRIHYTLLGVITDDKSEIEVIGKTITTLGDIIHHAGDIIPIENIEGQIIPYFLEKLKVEVTRFKAMKAISSVFNSDFINLSNVKQEFAHKFIIEILPFTTKPPRNAITAALECLHILVKFCVGNLLPQLSLEILSHINSVLAGQNDSHIIFLGFDLLYVMMDSQETVCLDFIKEKILPTLVSLPKSSSFFVSGGACLESLLNIWRKIAKNQDKFSYDQSFKLLMDSSKENNSKEVSFSINLDY
jgi:hypothetical protein